MLFTKIFTCVQNYAKRKKQEMWLDWQFIMKLAELEELGVPEEEMQKHVKIIYSEEEHHSKFLLDNDLMKIGFAVFRVKQSHGDVVYIYMKDGYRIVI